MQQSPRRTSRTRRSKNLWFERLMAIAVLVNFGLIVFDLSYTTLRNFWLLGHIKLPVLGLQVPVPLPPPGLCPVSGEQPANRATLITQCYDWVKGIEPHRDTENYLAAVDRLNQQIQQQGSQILTQPTGQAMLQELGQMSEDLIDTNPFEAVGKSGTLEKIKNLMRNHMKGELVRLSPAQIKQPFPTESPAATPPTADSLAASQKVSAKAAFRVFWSPLHLTPQTWQQQMRWFDTQIRPLIQTNYYRSIAENGAFTNRFWMIDLWFWGLFLTEFLARTYYISRRHPSLKWQDAMLWRWYDIPLILPFGFLIPAWAWVRVIPLAVRLDQAELVDMERVRQQAVHGLVSSIGQEMSEVVVLQVIKQLQAAMQRGDLMQWLRQPYKGKRITVNNVDELAEIAGLMLKITVYQVLPTIRPDLEALLQQSIESVLSQSPAYQTLKQVPGVGQLPAQVTDRLVADILHTTYSNLTAILDDPQNAVLAQRLVQHFGQSLGTEIQQQTVLQELRSLLTDFLEEVKLNYLQRSADVDLEQLLEESRQITTAIEPRSQNRSQWR